MSIGKYKYFGILKGFDFDNINKETFPLLIERGIFNEVELSECYQSKEGYFGIELQSQNEKINDFFLYNRKEYHLKKEVYFEMIKRQIERFDLTWNMCSFDYEIEPKLNNIFSDDEKIKTLNEINKKIYGDLTNEIFYYEYSLQLEKKEINQFLAFLIDEIELSPTKSENPYGFIAEYLKGEKKGEVSSDSWEYYFPEVTAKIWEECYLYDKAKEYLEEKKNIILNKEITTMVKKNELTAFQQVLLLEKVVSEKDWANFSSNKKAQIVSVLIGKNVDNIKKAYYKTEKGSSNLTEATKQDIHKIDELYSNLIG